MAARQIGDDEKEGGGGKKRRRAASNASNANETNTAIRWFWTLLSSSRAGTRSCTELMNISRNGTTNVLFNATNADAEKLRLSFDQFGRGSREDARRRRPILFTDHGSHATNLLHSFIRIGFVLIIDILSVRHAGHHK